MKELEYPFQSETILVKRKHLKRELLKQYTSFVTKRIAILSGSTVNDIVEILDLFLLQNGIQADFYVSEYGQYWTEVLFHDEKLNKFKPDLIYIHTCNRNIEKYPSLTDSEVEINLCLENEYEKYRSMWDKIEQNFNCDMIQNNFEYPYYRELGNMDSSDIHGKFYFINHLNEKFYEYARNHSNFYINDIMYLAASFGLEKWADPKYWYMYKYSLCLSAIPSLAFNIANIVKSIYGKNKKALILDLDNVLWGGIIGEDGLENIQIGQDSPKGEAFLEFQQYLKKLNDLGIILNICSKNDWENAEKGLRHSQNQLKIEDFVIIKSNWLPKNENVAEIYKELHLLPESIVFIDDNPSERELVASQEPAVFVPEMSDVEQYINVIDKSGFFEITTISNDDLARKQMYQGNLNRKMEQQKYKDYSQYLQSLNMLAEIYPFNEKSLPRIQQLISKTNQFNLTSKKYTSLELRNLSNCDNYIALYCSLKDKFGDNGIISAIIGRKEESILHIESWVLSCRVFFRDVEAAMMYALIQNCLKNGITQIYGYYYKNSKNSLVENMYKEQGFSKILENSDGNSIWHMDTQQNLINKNTIQIRM